MIGLLASLAMAGTAPPAALPALAAASSVATPDDATRTLELKWPNIVAIVTESAVNEVVVRFDHPLDDAEIARFVAEAGKDLADMRWNDTSLVMRAAEGRRIETEVVDKALRVRFITDEAAQAALAGDLQSADPDIDYAIAQAQVDAAAGYPGQARQRLIPLVERHPTNRQLQRALADAEAADGATMAAARRYRILAADDRNARRVIAEAGGNVAAGITLRHSKTFSQYEGNLSGSVAAWPGVTLGGGIRHIRSDADAVNGPLGLHFNQHSDRTIADIITGFSVGSMSKVIVQNSALLGKNVYGGSVRLLAGSSDQQARVILAYRLPDLSTSEQSIFGGHITRIGAGGSLRLTPELAVQADVAWNGYGLAGGGIRSKTVTVTGGFDYLFRRKSPSLALSYRIDGEYVDRVRRRLNGLEFIPLSNRENHSVQMVSSVSRAQTQFTGAVGWTVDRYGGNGPSANIGVTRYLGDKWRLEGNGGVSSVSKPGIPGRQIYVRLVLSRALGRL